jgi:hypothetical protein
MTEKQTVEEAWREVGRQFQTLGESLAKAFRSAWEREENRQHLEEMQAGLEAMVEEVDRAIKEASASPEAQKVRVDAEKAAETVRAAGEQAWQEARPHLLSALNRINTELEELIGRLRQREMASESPAAEAGPEEPADQ